VLTGDFQDIPKINVQVFYIGGHDRLKINQ